MSISSRMWARSPASNDFRSSATELEYVIRYTRPCYQERRANQVRPRLWRSAASGARAMFEKRRRPSRAARRSAAPGWAAFLQRVIPAFPENTSSDLRMFRRGRIQRDAVTRRHSQRGFLDATDQRMHRDDHRFHSSASRASNSSFPVTGCLNGPALSNPRERAATMAPRMCESD